MKERASFLRLGSAVVAACMVLSCRSSPESANSDENHVRSALEYSGVRPPRMSCVSSAWQERKGICLFEVSRRDFQSIVTKLHLEPVPPRNISYTVNGERPKQNNRHCATRPEFAEGDQTEEFFLGNKASVIRKATKAGLESLTLVRAEKTGLVCMVLSYAHG